jgi:hypothetical protein
MDAMEGVEMEYQNNAQSELNKIALDLINARERPQDLKRKCFWPEILIVH